MQFKETMSHKKHTNTLCGQTAEIFNAEADGTYCNHCGLKG
jgi:hypothetical protein